MKYYVVVYDRARAHLDELRAFTSRHDALRERFRWERLRPEAEVVVLAAPSEDALRRTHGRYFSTIGELLGRAEAFAE
jgi:hypothetical protein